MNSSNLVGTLVGETLKVRNFEKTESAKGDFSIRVFRRMNEEGEAEVDYFDCECWGKTTEILQQRYFNGAQVAITGTLRQSRWNDSTTGKGRSKVVIRIIRIDYLDRQPQPTVTAA